MSYRFRAQLILQGETFCLRIRGVLAGRNVTDLSSLVIADLIRYVLERKFLFVPDNQTRDDTTGLAVKNGETLPVVVDFDPDYEGSL